MHTTMALARTLQECGPDVLGCPGPLVIVDAACLCLGVLLPAPRDRCTGSDGREARGLSLMLFDFQL